MVSTRSDRTLGGARGRHSRACLGLLGIAVACLTPVTLAAQDVTVDQLELRLVPGQAARESAPLTISNVVGRTVQVNLARGDWDRSETGENRFFPLGTQPGTCGDRVQVSPGALQLGADASRTVRVFLADRDPWPTGCWTIVFVETVQPRAAVTEGRTGLTYTFRTGVKLFVEPAQAVRAAEFVALTVQPARGDAPALLDFTVRNTGGRQVVVRGTVELRGADNQVAATVTVPELYVLPGAVRRVQLPLPRLAAGSWVALALLDYDGPEVLAGQAILEQP